MDAELELQKVKEIGPINLRKNWVKCAANSDLLTRLFKKRKSQREIMSLKINTEQKKKLKPDAIIMVTE